MPFLPDPFSFGKGITAQIARVDNERNRHWQLAGVCLANCRNASALPMWVSVIWMKQKAFGWGCRTRPKSSDRRPSAHRQNDAVGR